MTIAEVLAELLATLPTDGVDQNKTAAAAILATIVEKLDGGTTAHEIIGRLHAQAVPSLRDTIKDRREAEDETIRNTKPRRET